MSITDATLLTMFVVAFVPLAPTEPVLASLGVLLATEHAQSGTVLEVIAVAAVGCCLSDHLLYGFGRFTGGRILDRLRRRPAPAAAIDWLNRNSRRWGVPVLIVGRWLPAGGTVGAILAGALRWPLRRFTPCSMIGSTLWSCYVVAIGFMGGTVAGQPLAGIALSLAVALLLGTASGQLLRRGQRRRSTTGPADPPTSEVSTGGGDTMAMSSTPA